MICHQCKTENKPADKVCSNCGHALMTPQRKKKIAERRERGADAAVTSFVCGMVGIFFMGMIMGVIAIVQARTAKKLKNKYKIAKAGFILGILDILILPVLMLIYYIVDGRL